jgi:hypothetical protein
MSDMTTGPAQARSDIAAEVARGDGLGLGAAARRFPLSGRGNGPERPARAGSACACKLSDEHGVS